MKAENQETVVNETEQIPFDESEPQPEAPLPGADAKEAMRKENYEAWVKVYEDFYQKPLVYGES